MNDTKEEEHSSSSTTTKPESKLSPSISEQNAAELLHKMIQLGYFHDSSKVMLNTPDEIIKKSDSEIHIDKHHEPYGNNDSIEGMKRMKKILQDEQNQCIRYSPTDKDCNLHLYDSYYPNGSMENDDENTSSSKDKHRACITQKQLQSKLKRILDNDYPDEDNDSVNNTLQGRIYLPDAAASTLFNLPFTVLQRAARELITLESSSSSPFSSSCRGDTVKKLQLVKRYGDDQQLSGAGETTLLSYKYLDKIVYQELDDTNLLESPQYGGKALISELACHLFDLPVDVTLEAIEERIGSMKSGGGVKILTKGGFIGSGDGSIGLKQIVTMDYEERIKERIRGALLGVTSPVSLDNLIEDFDWDPILIVSHIKSTCESGKLPGELHVGSESIKGAVYTPNVYTQMQKRTVVEFYASNGYVTENKCIDMGIVSIGAKMESYVKETFPDAIRLSSNSIISPNVIINPVQAVLQDCIAAKSFVDLRMHLPEGIIENTTTDDISEIMNNHVMPGLEDSESSTNLSSGVVNGTRRAMTEQSESKGGVLVLADGEILFFSNGMVQDIESKILPGLVETYGKERALEISAMDSVSESKKNESVNKAKGKRATARVSKGKQQQINQIDEEGRKLTAKEKRRNRKKTSAGDSEESSSSVISPGMIPLYIVAKDVAKHYPNLLDIQDSHGKLAETVKESPQWRKDNDDNNGGGGPIYEFCRVALFTQKLQKDCANAVKAEMDKIISTKSGASISSRKEGAAKVRMIEAAFEDQSCFPSSCYLVQMLAKLPLSLSTLNRNDSKFQMTLLEEDFLQGCATDFARRITEYCLFKHGINDVFEFDVERKDEFDLNNSSAFYLPVNMARKSFDTSYLHCTPSESRKSHDPLKVLRELLPGNVGTGLARMWVLTGGENYEGGRKVADDGSVLVRPGNLNGFLQHIEDSCFSMCGIPFKILDKKSEKHALFARRNEMTRLLEESTEAIDILELSIMLLFQQVRGIAVSGKQLNGPILNILQNEKKVPEEVTKKLVALTTCLEKKEPISEDLILDVKSYGLSRDISKHTFED